MLAMTGKAAGETPRDGAQTEARQEQHAGVHLPYLFLYQLAMPFP